jgi:hypothetical protein
MTADNVLYSAPLYYTLSGDTTTYFTVTDRETDKLVDRAALSLDNERPEDRQSNR